jgi:hypothetical protein
MDQGRQTGGEDDSSFLSSVSLEPSAAGAESVGVQLGESVAAAGGDQSNREVVVNESAATTDEDRRTAGKTRPILLAFLGRRTPESTAIRSDAESDRTAADTEGIIIGRWSSPHRNETKAYGARRGIPKERCILG